MTAVVSPPTLPQISRPAWGTISGNNSMDPDEVRGMFAPRKQLSRSNSASSLASNSSNTSVATNGSQSNGTNGTSLSATSDLSQWSSSTVPRKRAQPKGYWPPGKTDAQFDYPRVSQIRPNGMVAPHNIIQAGHGQNQLAQSQQTIRGQLGPEHLTAVQPVLYLLSLNGTFERKTIAVPFAPESLRIGRQTNQKTVPTATNGFFDSKVLSRQHAEIYAERNGKIYIRDVKSSNGTFVNGTRLSQENRESEPHELQTADHLELGIDIVSEDQKTVVHHKVAAKVEHAGFLSNTNNVMDMNFGDLDPANGTMMIPNGPLHTRGRPNVNMVNPGGRMLPSYPGLSGQGSNISQQRSFFLAPIATDQILKRLASELKSARLQGQDLGRANQFVATLLTKDDVKDLDKSEVPESARHQSQPSINGGLPFRPDPKTRFSEPPAPPPQQPLPEKPNVPSLKRGSTERPNAMQIGSAVARSENMSQILQLTEALNNAKRDIDSQSARIRELEEMLRKEREARELAEDLAKRLEASAHFQPNESLHKSTSSMVPPLPLPLDNESELSVSGMSGPVVEALGAEAEDPAANGQMSTLQARINDMDRQLSDMQGSLQQWMHRCEVAERERDESNESLIDMVARLRIKEAEESSSTEKPRSVASRRGRGFSGDAEDERSLPADSAFHSTSPRTTTIDAQHKDGLGDGPSLSRANTITPFTHQGGVSSRADILHAGLPYASMLGVVLVGMGLMAYMNGWQPSSARLE